MFKIIDLDLIGFIGLQFHKFISFQSMMNAIKSNQLFIIQQNRISIHSLTSHGIGSAFRGHDVSGPSDTEVIIIQPAVRCLFPPVKIYVFIDPFKYRIPFKFLVAKVLSIHSVFFQVFSREKSSTRYRFKCRQIGCMFASPGINDFIFTEFIDHSLQGCDRVHRNAVVICQKYLDVIGIGTYNSNFPKVFGERKQLIFIFQEHNRFSCSFQSKFPVLFRINSFIGDICPGDQFIRIKHTQFHPGQHQSFYRYIYFFLRNLTVGNSLQ